MDHHIRKPLVAFVLFVLYSASARVDNNRSCAIDLDNHSVTAHNLKYNCNTKQLEQIFANLPAGTYPPNGKLKGSILIDGLQEQNVWSGKTLQYRKGSHYRGTLTNILFRRYNLFNAEFYRTIAPIDGNEAFALNYKSDPLVPYVIDYIREVQNNLHLGIMTIRPMDKLPVLYFMLEKESTDQL